MKRGTQFLTSLTLVAAATSASAQVPVDEGVRFTFNRDPLNPVSPGIELVDVSGGTATPLAGLLAIDYENNCGTIDPINGDIISGGYGFSNGWIRRIALSGTTVSSASTIVNIGSELGLKDIVYGDNGDLYTTNGKALYVVDRATSTPVVRDAAVAALSSSSSANAMTFDLATGILYIAIWGPAGGTSGLVSYDTYNWSAPKVSLISMSSTPYSSELTGLTHDGAGNLFVSCWDNTGSSVLRYELGTGTISAVPGSPNFGVNAVHYNRRTGQLHLVGAGRDGVVGDSEYYTLDPNSGVLTQITSGSVVGAPSDVVVNDMTDLTTLFPRLPSTAVDMTIETAAHGNPGEVAGLAITAINGAPVSPPIELVVGACDSAGIVSYTQTIPAGTFPPGTQFTVTSARIDGGTSVVIGTSETLKVGT
jgi:hypothetical protein